MLILVNKNKYIINLFLPEFRLLVLCNKLLHGNIVNLYPYLSYPIIAIELSSIEMTVYKKETNELIKECLNVTLEWLRLLISLFSDSDSNDVIKMCYLRCDNIKTLNNYIKSKFKDDDEISIF